MKSVHYIVVSAVIGLMSSASCYAGNTDAGQMQANAAECATHTRTDQPAGAASQPPVISIGVSDPNTKLNLPWFLTDIVNAANTHQSARCLLHTLKNGI